MKYAVKIIMLLVLFISAAIGPAVLGQTDSEAPKEILDHLGRPVPQAGGPLDFTIRVENPPDATIKDGKQPQPQPTTGMPAEPTKTGASDKRSQAPAVKRPVASTGTFSLNFDDADVFSVIQTVFGEILRVNYIVDPRVKGRVTFRSVAPVSRDQVLPVMEVILRINGIGVVEESGLYRVVPISEVSREPSPVSIGRDPDKIPTTGKSLIQVIPISYLQSTEVVKLVTPFVSVNSVVLDVPKSNQIIIVDTDASIKRILGLIDTFDNETQKKKRAQVFVYPVQNGKAKDIAALLQQIFLGAKPTTGTTSKASTTATASGKSATPQPATAIAQQQAQALAPPLITSITGGESAAGEMLVSNVTKIFADEIINAVIVLATPEDYETIKETIAKIDIIPRQVVIEGVIAQVNLTDNLSLGLAYAFKTQIKFGRSIISGDIGMNTDTLTNMDSTDTTIRPSRSGFSYIGTDSKGLYRAYINALASESKGKLLAAPHILVSDNREARIQVGQQVPIVTSETFGSTTVAPQRTIEYKDIGIILKVKPQVNDSGLISLDIAQEISSYSTIELITNEKSIVVNKTEASTNLAVQDGETIIIGGLIREDNTNTEMGVPFLSKIPLLGFLFGNRSRETQRQELIILLTPHVLKSQKEAKNITNEYIDNITNVDITKGGIKREELLKSGVQTRRGIGNKAPGVAVPGENLPPDKEPPSSTDQHKDRSQTPP